MGAHSSCLLCAYVCIYVNICVQFVCVYTCWWALVPMVSNGQLWTVDPLSFRGRITPSAFQLWTPGWLAQGFCGSLFSSPIISYPTFSLVLGFEIYSGRIFYHSAISPAPFLLSLSKQTKHFLISLNVLFYSNWILILELLIYFHM